MHPANVAPLTPLLFLERARRAFPNKEAVVDGVNRLTYQEFYDYCLRLSSALKNSGIQPGQKVACLCGNSLFLLAAHYAVPMCGAVLVTINSRLLHTDVEKILLHSETVSLFCDARLFHPSYCDCVSTVILTKLLPTAAEVNHLAAWLNKYKGTSDMGFSLSEEMPITLNYTSGTSGSPKGVLYSHRGAYLNALGECVQVGLSVHSTYLWVLPMFHCNGWCFTWAVTGVGGRHICLSTFDADVVIRQIIAEKVTHFCAAPTVLIKLQASQYFEDLKEHAHLTVITAGASPPAPLVEAYEDMGISILHVYGMTETYGPHLVCEPVPSWTGLSTKEVAQLKAAQGVPSIHGTFVAVVDKNMRPVPFDGVTTGEIVMRGNNIMMEYYNDAAATEHAFSGGWLHSGDMAVVCPNGYIVVKDRIKDIIISGGENVASIEVEAVLYQHPAVLVAAVIPEPDTVWGDCVHAIIECKLGHMPSADEIIQFCKARLTHYMCPKKVTFSPIPKTSTGKIKKSLLKEQFYHSSTLGKEVHHELCG